MNKGLKYNWEVWFFLSIPIINVFGWFFGFFFTRGFLNPGNLRAYIILLFVIFVIFKRFYLNSVNLNILWYLIFTFALIVLFSSDIPNSLYIFMKFFMSTSLFFVGYYYSKIPGVFKLLCNSYIVTLAMYILAILLANLFSIGYTSYEGVSDIMFFGPSGVNISKNIVSIILIFPLLKYLNKTKAYARTLNILMLVSIILVFIAFKRTPMLSISLGFLVYLVLTPKKTRMIKTLIGSVTLLLLLSPLYLNRIEQNYIARQDAIRLDDPENIDKQARYHEIFMTLEAFEKGNVRHKLFGSEFFNDRCFYGTPRMLHTDYMSLLSGTGLVGLIWFLLIYYKIYSHIRNLYLKNKTDLTRDLYIVGVILIINSLVLGIAGTIPAIDPRSIIFLYLGAITGFLHFLIHQNRSKESQLK